MAIALVVLVVLLVVAILFAFHNEMIFGMGNVYGNDKEEEKKTVGVTGFDRLVFDRTSDEERKIDN